MPLTLEQALARVPGWTGAKQLATTPLGGGITNQNYRVDVDGESFVLRICGADTELLGTDREAEYLANRAAGELGIAPEVFYRIQPENYLVTRFIAGRPVPPDEIQQPENICRITDALKQFHALPLVLPANFSALAAIEHLSEAARRCKVEFPRNFDELLARAREVDALFRAAPLPICPCHDDLLNANFLQTDRIYILDWEYAGMGDVTFDLANFASHHRLDDRRSHHLLECYWGQSTPKRFARLQLMRPLSEMREAAWGLVQIGLSQLDFDFRAYADLWFERATESFNAPRRGDWIKEMTHV